MEDFEAFELLFKEEDFFLFLLPVFAHVGVPRLQILDPPVERVDLLGCVCVVLLELLSELLQLLVRSMHHF